MILSSSEISCYQQCPRKYRHRYVDRRVPLIQAEELMRGKRAHKALTEWQSGREIDVREMPPAERAMMRGYISVYARTLLAVNVPFRVEVAPGLFIVGEFDAAIYDDQGNVRDIIEHKTTSSDISPGGQYWKRVVLVDPQVSVYSLAFPCATVLYDVLRKPALRQKQGETESQYEERCLAAIAEEPEKYFARFTVVRLEEDAKATVEDIRRVAYQLEPGADLFERNPRACFDYGRECEYFGVCFEGRSLAGPDFTDWPGHELDWVAKERNP